VLAVVVEDITELKAVDGQAGSELVTVVVDAITELVAVVV
jgi:hypothetical protein